MWSPKWVQSIECGGDECFIRTLPPLTWWQTFLLFLNMCPMVFRTGLRPFRRHISILGVLRHSNLLGFAVVLSYLLWGFFDGTSQCVLLRGWSLLTHSCHRLLIFPQYIYIYCHDCFLFLIIEKEILHFAYFVGKIFIII